MIISIIKEDGPYRYSRLKYRQVVHVNLRGRCRKNQDCKYCKPYPS